MNRAVPTVSVGVPVYNGENYLAAALDSLLAQTFCDFEIVISDNASTDGTRSICQAYAARDPRVRYYREEINHGAIWNCNRVFDLSRGEYFKLQAHDDVCAPTLLARLVEVLDHDLSTVICFPRTAIIDGNGELVISDDASDQTGIDLEGLSEAQWRERREKLISVSAATTAGVLP